MSAPIPSVKHWQFERVAKGAVAAILLPDQKMPMAQALGHFDICVNCVMQDADAPLMFVRTEELESLRPGTLIVDVSCDRGMGFEFARPTSFDAPSFFVGPERRVLYYAVDHSPSYLWDGASHEISNALVPLLDDIATGPDGWRRNPTLARSLEIVGGHIKNSTILRFQGREPDYPHLKLQPEPGPA